MPAGFFPQSADGRYTFIDSFCGAGGVTDGWIKNPMVKVTHAINHSPEAIECYKANNPDVVCFEEDFADMNEKVLPRKTNFFWMSAECTHHSIAAGGNSRDPDSRSLPEHAERYIRWCNPDYVLVENVKEFLDWGPVEPKLDKDGNVVMKYDKETKSMKPVLRPVKALKKTFYNRWVKQLKALGYEYDYRILNAADYGAPTTRKRYFGCFARKGLPMVFPKPSHTEDPRPGSKLKKWIPAKDVLDLEYEGESIFGRKHNTNLPKNRRKPLAPNSQKRVAYGLKKFFLQSFIAKAYSAAGQVSSLDEPLHTVTTVDRHALTSVELAIEEERQQFLTQNIHGCLNAQSIYDPLPTALTRDEKSLVTAFIDKDNTNEYNVQSVEEPLHAAVTRDSKKLVTVKVDNSKPKSRLERLKESEKVQFILTHFGTGRMKFIGEPLPTILCTDKHTLVTVEYLCSIIKDIKMRYLTSQELARATGFADSMSLGRSETVRKKHIGNAVPPAVPEAWSFAFTAKLSHFLRHKKQVA